MSDFKALVFCLDGQRHALPAYAVERVVRAVEITPLPGAPPLVQGVVDVGGRVLPVLDLRRRMELPARDPACADDQLMIVDTGARSVVLPIDEAQEVVDVDPAAFDSAEAAAGSRAPLLGVLRLADGLVWLHDIERLFAPADAEAFDLAWQGARERAEA